jgi:hypothetical protein
MMMMWQEIIIKKYIYMENHNFGIYSKFRLVNNTKIIIEH